MSRVLSPRPLLALALLGGWPAPARAQQLPPDARFSYDLFEGTSQTPVSGTLFYTPGTPLTVRVYLRQTAGTEEVIARDGGLFTGGVRLTYGAPSGSSGVINVASVNDIVINSGTAPTQFDPALDLSNGTRQRTDDYAQFTPTSSFTRGALPGTDGRVFLGTVTFQTPGAGAGTTTLTLDDIPPPADDVATFAGIDANPSYTLDNPSDDRVDPFSVNVVPVPEPATTLVAGAAGLAGLGAIRRARRKRAGAGC